MIGFAGVYLPRKTGKEWQNKMVAFEGFHVLSILYLSPPQEQGKAFVVHSRPGQGGLFLHLLKCIIRLTVVVTERCRKLFVVFGHVGIFL